MPKLSRLTKRHTDTSRDTVGKDTDGPIIHCRDRKGTVNVPLDSVWWVLVFVNRLFEFLLSLVFLVDSSNFLLYLLLATVDPFW